MDARTSPEAASLWRDIATETPAAQPSLSGELEADVAIIGGGYTGLTAASRLIQRGCRPVVLEANRIGWGGSGRNGGVVSAKVRQSLPMIARQHGVDMAREINHLCHQAVDEVEAIIDSFGITEARFRRTGSLRCAHHRRALETTVAEAEWVTRTLGDAKYRQLSAQEVFEETGSTAFTGGILTEGVGTVYPLAYVRGLARALVERHGLPLFENTPAMGLQRTAGGIVVKTPHGEVRAKQAIMATNAYSSETGVSYMIRSRMVPFRTSIIATEPLPDELNRHLLVNERSYTETRRMMRWFRKVDNRFVFGGRGAFGKQDSAMAFDALQRAMVSMFPELEDVAVTHHWSGHVGMTLDSLPHVGRFDDRLCYAVGYNGSGVALSTLFGRLAADFALGDASPVALFEAARLKSVPFYPLREFGIRLVAGWYQFLDASGR